MEDQLIASPAKKINKKVLAALEDACKKMAPVWPLESFVAVNPYLGLSAQRFESAALDLSIAGGIQMTLPVSFYLQKISAGQITQQDLQAAMQHYGSNESDPQAFIDQLKHGEEKEQSIAAVSSMIDVAAALTQKDWNRFVVGRISAWAASYFDKGQAGWTAADQQTGIYASWKKEASTDLTPEISGLKNFRKIVRALPDDPFEAAQTALDQLDLPAQALPVYLQRLLLRMGGWAAYAARLDWESALYGGEKKQLIEFLSLLICWEYCLFQSLNSPQLRVKWFRAKKIYADDSIMETVKQNLQQKLILQQAFDNAAQKILIKKINGSSAITSEEKKRAKAQAIFCIDVRSEVIRRNIEMADPGIETLGFAGFFAFPIEYVPLAHEQGEAQCPALVQTGPVILEDVPDINTREKLYRKRILQHQTEKVWKSFKSGAVTCFSFVSPLGLSYLVKLFTDSFGITRPVPDPEKLGYNKSLLPKKTVSIESVNNGAVHAGIPFEQRVSMAKNALKAMSLTNEFAEFVLIVGHASSSVNNPHASGLDCGACGGHSGEANAKVAAAVLNDKAVRKELKLAGIHIPDETVFLACLHNTSIDEISIFNEQDIAAYQWKAYTEIKEALVKAGKNARAERALRMAIEGEVDNAIKERSRDWSQVRPEWGLAGCSSFVVAPRHRTSHLNFGGQTFLHSYEWKQDQDFSVLELIMTAPMTVCSWINLQYYASTVDNKHYGAGNKTLHNVTAGLGVLEGYSGDLRVGLPMQSLHDGARYQHEPIRLTVIIEAPVDAMNKVIEKHASVRQLCDNGWLQLYAMNDQGKVAEKYVGGLMWEKINS